MNEPLPKLTAARLELVLTDLSKEINEWAHKQGFWTGEGCSVGDKIALMHSELSEALEYHRHNDPPSDHIPAFSGVEEEMADVVIRVLDFCYEYNLRLSEAIVAKIAFNHSRPFKNGKENF